MYERTREMLSRISRSRRLDWLEDMDFVLERARDNVGFEFIASCDIDPLRNEFLDFGDDFRVVKQVYGSLSVEVHKQINVAVRALRPAGCGAKERQVPDAKFPKARRGRPKSVDHRRNFLRAGCYRRRGCVPEYRAAWEEGDAGSLKCQSDGGESGRNGPARSALKVGDGQPRDAGLPGQLGLRDAKEGSGGAAHFRS